MTLAMAIALAAVLNGGVANIIKVIEDLKASGHPLDAPLPPDVMDKLKAAFAECSSAEGTAGMDALIEWDANHTDNGG